MARTPSNNRVRTRGIMVDLRGAGRGGRWEVRRWLAAIGQQLQQLPYQKMFNGNRSAASTSNAAASHGTVLTSLPETHLPPRASRLATGAARPPGRCAAR